MDTFLARILDQPPWLIYLATFGIVFLEDAIFIGFVVPGETLAILGGVSASLGHTELVWMILGVVLAAIIGDSVGYEVGKYYGTRILQARAFAKHEARIDKAQEFLRTRGGSAVFLGRWTAFFRAVMPALAGASRMPYRTFLPWNALGGATWGLVVVLAGYLAGMSYQRVARWLGGGAAAIVALIVIGAFLVWHIRRRRADRANEAALAHRDRQSGTSGTEQLRDAASE